LRNFYFDSLDSNEFFILGSFDSLLIGDDEHSDYELQFQYDEQEKDKLIDSINNGDESIIEIQRITLEHRIAIQNDFITKKLMWTI
jgi:hypothetical protein